MYPKTDSLMNDILFKETFADKDNRRQLEFLLELLLEYPEGYLKNRLEVKYESPLKKENAKEKSVRGDIIIHFDDMTINLEAYQVFNTNSIDKSLYYVMRIQANKLEVGNDYYKLGKTIQINFVEKTSLKLGNELVANFHIAYDKNPKIKLLENSFVIKVVQIDKARKLGYTNNVLERWLQFIAARNKEERNSIAKGDELLVELNEWIDKYVNDEETREKLNKWDIQIAKSTGYELGKEEGIAQRNVEIAKQMIEANIKIEDISKFTGLSMEEIENLKEREK